MTWALQAAHQATEGIASRCAMAREEEETPKVSEDTDVHALASWSKSEDLVALPEFIRGLAAAKRPCFP